MHVLPVDVAQQRTQEVVERYNARYRRQDQAFRIFDAIIRALVWPWARRQSPIPVAPRRILLVNAGHLGDVIISTGLLPVLRDAFPGTEIGILTGSYSRVLVDRHELISRVHLIDHWYLSRGGRPKWRRVFDYLGDLPRVVRDVRAAKYDIAIDVRSWFPNLVPVLWLAGIPVRVGYDRVGWGPLLTHRQRYAYDRHHELHAQLRLLSNIGVSDRSLQLAWPTLTAPGDAARAEAATLLKGVSRYRILHAISSTPMRDWPADHWQILARDLLASGITPVITGSGDRDRAFAERLSAAVPGCLNAVGSLSWAGLVAAIGTAEAVYAVETSIGHVASALGRPVISIYGGMADPAHWAPLGAVVATNVLACHPCIDKNGCTTRDCILGVTVQDVHEAARVALAGPSPHAAAVVAVTVR